jgi:Tat protein secretion system quality control protein TatD with DNase activity
MLFNAHVHDLPGPGVLAFLQGLNGVYEYVPNDAVFPFYGVHPWYADSVEDDWLVQLVARVQSTACGLGEIGLDSVHAQRGHHFDKLSDRPLWERQKAVFEIQLKLAQKFARPVSLHVVHAWPDIFAALEKYPVQAMVHQFTGSRETAKRLLDLGCYLSLAPDKYTDDVLKYIPLKRLFLEDEKNIFLEKHYQQIAAIKNISVELLSEEIIDNATTFTHHTFAR